MKKLLFVSMALLTICNLQAQTSKSKSPAPINQKPAAVANKPDVAVIEANESFNLLASQIIAIEEINVNKEELTPIINTQAKSVDELFNKASKFFTVINPELHTTDLDTWNSIISQFQKNNKIDAFKGLLIKTEAMLKPSVFSDSWQKEGRDKWIQSLKK